MEKFKLVLYICFLKYKSVTCDYKCNMKQRKSAKVQRWFHAVRNILSCGSYTILWGVFSTVCSQIIWNGFIIIFRLDFWEAVPIGIKYSNDISMFTWPDVVTSSNNARKSFLQKTGTDCACISHTWKEYYIIFRTLIQNKDKLIDNSGKVTINMCYSVCYSKNYTSSLVTVSLKIINHSFNIYLS